MSSRTRRLLLSLLALAAISTGSATAAGESVRAAPAPRPSCSTAPGPTGRSVPIHLHRPRQVVTRRDRLVAVVRTNCGRFAIDLDARRAPKIVNSFVYLARSGFYDGLLFYRVAPDFVIQGGSFPKDGISGPGYHVTEPPPPGFNYRFGTVAMTKTATEPSGRAGSDFFIVTGQGNFIRDEYAILGRVRAGTATVRRIDALGNENERPSQVVRIASIRIRRDG